MCSAGQHKCFIELDSRVDYLYLCSNICLSFFQIFKKAALHYNSILNKLLGTGIKYELSLYITLQL